VDGLRKPVLAIAAAGEMPITWLAWVNISAVGASHRRDLVRFCNNSGAAGRLRAISLE